ncbi:MAG: saccharopine dehydrogenase NADP-binding domain-containing protein [Gemmatimonadetes bacterium]|nr:saccharopine dehydrogenase NADP-binding domain-containing protein [Gemmatimonadota bacterium]
MAKVLVLGAGEQGRATAFDLLREPGVEFVRLADLQPKRIPSFLERHLGGRLEAVAVDARDHTAVRALMERHDACLCALPYYFNLDMTRLAIEAGVHFADLGGNTEIVRRQLELDDAAARRGITVIPDCGLAPGMVNILAAAAMRRMERVTSVAIRVGGLPQHPEPPLHYTIVYSLEGVVDYYTTSAWVLRDGRLAEVEALDGLESVTFPVPVGELEAFYTAGGISMMPWRYEGRVAQMDYKTLRYPGHAAIVKAIRGLGLLSSQPVKVNGAEVVPRRVFIACAEPVLRKPVARDLVAMRVEVQGEKDGRPLTVRYELLDFYDEENGITAMERSTGYSLSITGLMQMDGRITERGVRTPDGCVPVDAYLAELARRGIEIRKTESGLAGLSGLAG